MKKVIIFLGNFSFGGAEVVGVNLANSFIDKGMEVTVLCLQKQGDLLKRLSDKVDVVSLDKRLAFSFLKLRNFILSQDERVLIISTIRNLNIAMSVATLWSNPRCKFIYREANTYRNLLNSFKGTLIWLFYALVNNWAYHKAKVVIANSNDTKTDLKKLCTVSLAQKIIVIGNPIHIKPEHTSSINYQPPSLSNEKSHPVILSVGRLHPQKDYFLGLRVFKKLTNTFPNAIYIILGEGSLLQELKDFANSLGLRVGKNVFFAGTSLNPQEYYLRSDLFFMTSKWEGFGNVIVEAMGYGLTPLVCHCPGGPSDIIGSDYGYYVDSRDPVKIAYSLEEALKKKINKDILVKRAKQYSSDYIAELYLDSVKH